MYDNDKPIPKNSDLAQQLAARVHLLRRVLGIPIAVLARRAGVRRIYLATFEARGAGITPYVLRRLANALGICFEDLIDGLPMPMEPKRQDKPNLLN